ncbi:MAG: OmpA family protein [Rickettsiales bacterium]|jgi:chemotaxis protein MotB|nr:OmpA family protein [Rickettsiales bacterium]
MIKLRERVNTWPGFVDLFSNLVIILIFLLIVFVFLWTTTSVFSTANGTKKIADLRRANIEQSEQLAQMTADEKDARELLIAARTALENLESDKTSLEDDRATLARQVTDKNEMLQKLISDYENSLQETRDDSVRLTAQIRDLEKQLLASEQKGDIAASELEMQRQALQSELARMNELLTIAETKAIEKETEYIEMSSRLNRALADRVAEMNGSSDKKDQGMKEYQSQFYKAVTTALADFRGVDLSNDRFVISSDILFPSGSYSLSPEGKNQLRIIANIMMELEAKMPTDVNWIIRVDGHTDKKPVIAGTRYKNNMELSLLRAKAVIAELVRDGVSARRLIPSGFGDLYPIELGNTADALQKNRRIELRLTNP